MADEVDEVLGVVSDEDELLLLSDDDPDDDPDDEDPDEPPELDEPPSGLLPLFPEEL